MPFARVQDSNLNSQSWHNNQIDLFVPFLKHASHPAHLVAMSPGLQNAPFDYSPVQCMDHAEVEQIKLQKMACLAQLSCHDRAHSNNQQISPLKHLFRNQVNDNGKHSHPHHHEPNNHTDYYCFHSRPMFESRLFFQVVQYAWQLYLLP